MIRLMYKPLSLLVSSLAGVVAVVKAAADRGAAEGARKLLGAWPGESPGNGTELVFWPR